MAARGRHRATGAVRDVLPRTRALVLRVRPGQGQLALRSSPGPMSFSGTPRSSNFGQMYLYDLTTGKLKNQITHGDGPVNQVLYIDREGPRALLRSLRARRLVRIPYFHALLSRGLRWQDISSCSRPKIADHAITPSAPDGGDLRRRLLHQPDGAADRGAARQHWQAARHASQAGHHAACCKAIGWKPPTYPSR